MNDPGLFLIYDLAVPALSVILLGFALFVGLSNRRQPSILVECFIMALVGVRIVQVLVANYDWDAYWTLISGLAFISARYIAEVGPPWAPYSWTAYIWTPFTYAILHWDGVHLFGNGIALFIFGRTVAWRLGRKGFLWLFFLASAAGAAFEMAFDFFSTVPMIGASAGAVGVMGATFRFVPRAEDRLKALFWPDKKLRQLPLLGIRDVLSESRSLVYVVTCFVIYPLGLIAYFLGTSGNVAVMGHLGGFVFGFFSFPYFDRHRPIPKLEQNGETDIEVVLESVAMRLLRALAILMMIVGIIAGIVGYYLQALIVWQG